MPNPLNIFVVSNGRHDEKSLCSQLRDFGHTCTFWNQKEHTLLGDNTSIDKVISGNSLCFLMEKVAGADLLVLFSPMHGESFFAGVAHTSGIRIACIGDKDAEICPLTKFATSYWCESIDMLLDVVNNWQDPIL